MEKTKIRPDIQYGAFKIPHKIGFIIEKGPFNFFALALSLPYFESGDYYDFIDETKTYGINLQTGIKFQTQLGVFYGFSIKLFGFGIIMSRQWDFR